MKVALVLPRLRDLQPSACETDARVVLDTDTQKLSLRTSKGEHPLDVCGTRELRLIARQLDWFADHIDRSYEADFEELAE